VRADPAAALRVLLAVSRYPWPPRRGDQLRTLQAVEALASRHRLTVLLPEPPPGAPAPPAGFPAAIETYRPPWRPRRSRQPRPGGALATVIGAAGAALGAVLGRNPLQAVLFASPDLDRALRRHASSADVAILQLVRLAPSAGALAGTPTVVDLIDSLALSTGRRARFDRPWLAPWLWLESRLLARAEERLVAGSACALVVSERDRAALAGRLAPGLAERLRVVPVAVERDEPTTAVRGAEQTGGEAGAAPAPGEPGSDAPPVLALTGNLGYFPTREGACWWLRRVWPRLRTALPEARLVLAGSRVPRSLARQARAAGAEVLDDPPDLAAVLAGARLALAPMRAGAGQPLKVLEAWAAGVPVVATRWAAAGTSGRADGADGEEDLVVADEADQWVERIRALWGDRERRRRIAAAARRRLEADYSASTVRAAWTECVEAAASAASRRARSVSPPSWK